MLKAPEDMSPSERISEVGALLATGIMRLKSKIARKNNKLRDISLDSSGNQSVHATATLTKRRKHE